MDAKQYQQQSRNTYRAIEPHDEAHLGYIALGLVNEAGELAGKVKKIWRDKHGVIDNDTRTALKGELGDVLWYLTQICTNLDLSLEDVMQANIDKLASRQARGKIGGSGDNR